MKNYTKLLFVTLFLFSSKVFCLDNYEDVFYKACLLEKNQCYKEACTEYKRYLFLQKFSELSHKAESYTALSNYYRRNNNYDLALFYINQALGESHSQTKNNSAYDKLLIEKIDLLKYSYKEKKLRLENDVQIQTILNFENYSKDVQIKAFVCLIKNQLDNNEIEAAILNFKLLVSKFPTLISKDEQAQFESAIIKIQSFKPKNPKLAAGLSVIPGLGQLYAENYSDALNAFLLDGSLIALCTYSLCTKQFFDFSLLEISPTFKFYKGNFVHAQEDTYEYNRNKRNEYLKPAIEILDKFDK